MSLKEEMEFLSEYNRWAAEKKVSGVDTTPGTFLVERAQQGAYEKLEKVIKYAKDMREEDNALVKAICESILEIIEGD